MIRRRTIHEAVLVEETMLLLNVRAGGWYLDGTLGGGTHTEALLQQSAPDGKVLSLDVDARALERACEKFADVGERWIGEEENFRRLDASAKSHGMIPLDGIVLDLGLSSDELADSAKGLSFLRDGPLDMRLGDKANDDGLTAAEIVNSWSRADLEAVLRRFGEERFASRIVHAIAEQRRQHLIVRTLEFAEIVKAAVPKNYEQGRIHPATRTFQALRMVVNDELETLRAAIDAAHRVLKIGGRLVVISFHSLEDRVAKQSFANAEAWETLSKKPITPSENELAMNSRARSAKLRGAAKKSRE